MATKSAGPVTSEQVLAKLRRRQRALVEAYMRELVPGYERHQKRLRDMHEAGELTISLLVQALSAGRPITRSELDFVRSYLRRALLRGATEGELVRAAQLWQRVLWDALEELAGPDGGALVARLSRPLIDYVDELSDAVSESVEEIQAARKLTAREGRSELLEDLLAGRPVAVGARLGALRACGLADADVLVLVVAARPLQPFPDPAAAAVAAVALAHAPGDAVEPLFAVRGDEVVVVRATPDPPQRLVDALTTAHEALTKDGIVLAVGVSTVHAGRAGVPAAYDEACLARERAPTTGGLLAIPALRPLEYLFLRGADATAWSLVPPAIREFVERDLAQAGLLVETLMAYLACDLNVKAAAERLHVHANTAHYRLAKIEELTACDLRDLDDLQELAIAVRLARHRAA
ncbi:PucR family transcriptional regulator [Patulibacter medicamentivorans]|nr:helix-turn-helix domain-containing protein [Patulibacter medicamentivorans]